MNENVIKIDEGITQLSGTVSAYTKSITGVDVEELIKKQRTQDGQK